jgi:hypothetical protein
LVSVSAPVPQRLLDSVDESTVVAYVKDLDGRYLHVNSRYLEFFEVGLEDIRGRADDELTARQTVDGPRIASGSVSEDEPIQLEYTVAPFEGRPALAVWRFAVRAGGGDTVAVCGVAAPVVDAALARRECERLMAAVDETESPVVEEAIEPQTDEHRITALHEASASAAKRAHELLSELTEERERRAEAETLAAESDELRRRLEAVEAVTLAERGRADEADAAARRERERVDAANAAVLAERARADEVTAELGTSRGELAAVRGRLEGAETTVQAERARAEAAEAGAQAARTRAEEAEMVAQAARSRTEEIQTSLDAARAELASELGHTTHNEQELVDDLRRRLEEANDTARAERSRADSVRAELEAARSELALARAELQTAPAGELLDDLRHKLAHAETNAHRNRERADAAEAALNAERADAEIRVGVVERRIAELEGSLAEARAHELEADTEHAATGPTWGSSAQRAFTTALSQSADWRVSVKSAIGVVGSQGGWDAVCAWQPDDLNGFASCFAMWTGENRRLGALETATWQRRQPLTGSTIGEALTSEESGWLAADPRAADRRLQLLAQHGIRGALIVPVKDGAQPVAALELLTVGAAQPSRELVDAIETIALQLGHFSHLLSAGAQPRWRFGRA